MTAKKENSSKSNKSHKNKKTAQDENLKTTEVKNIDIKVEETVAVENQSTDDISTENAEEDNGNQGGKPKKRKFKMPNAYIIVFLALLVAVILTYFVPVSVYSEQHGGVVYNAMFDQNGEIIRGVGPQPDGLWDLLVAPLKGFISASDVGIALMMAGGFLKLLSYSGALEAGIGKMLSKMQGNILIALMTLAFAIFGTVFGLWEELPAFAIVVVPLFVIAGYDVMTGIAILFIGATIGNMAAVVNPFATGAAVAAINNPDLTLGSGIVLRALIFLVLYIIGTAFIIKYASNVKANKEKSVLATVKGVKTGTDEGATLPDMTSKRRNSIIIFAIIVILMLIGYTPWHELGGDAAYNFVNAPIFGLAKVPFIGVLIGAAHITPLGKWGFNEFAFLFFAGSFALWLVNRFTQKEFFTNFIDGIKDLLGVVLVLAIARGIAIVMGDSTSGMSVTFVYWISTALAKVPLWIFGTVAVLAYVSIGLFLQSTSGVAAISMPILGAVAAALFTGAAAGEVGGQVVLISAFALGINFMSGIYPSATTMGTLELFKVPYDVYLKFMLKRLIPLLLIGTIIISIAPYIGLAR